MELRNKVYQMFMIAPQGLELQRGGNLEVALKNGLGGVIFFTKNISDKSQIKLLIEDVKRVALVPPFLGIDQEGGRVERTENLFGGKKFLSARFQAEGGLDCVISQTTGIADLINDLGFNMNFAPVLDVDTNPNNPIIAERAYGRTAEKVEQYALCAMDIYLQKGIIPVGKHFPGHGDVNTDSHLTLPILSLNRNELENAHIRPFKSAIKKGIPAIMVAHLCCPVLVGNDKTPTSLSCDVMDYLRKELDFGGIIISDDMQMGALENISFVDAVVTAIRAGVNIFLYRESTDEIISIIEEVISVVENDNELKKNVEYSFELIQNSKQKYLSNN